MSSNIQPIKDSANASHTPAPTQPPAIQRSLAPLVAARLAPPPPARPTSFSASVSSPLPVPSPVAAPPPAPRLPEPCMNGKMAEFLGRTNLAQNGLLFKAALDLLTGHFVLIPLELLKQGRPAPIRIPLSQFTQESLTRILKDCVLVDVRLLKIPELPCGFVIQSKNRLGQNSSFSIPDAAHSIALARAYSLKANDQTPRVYRIQHFEPEDFWTGLSNPIQQQAPATQSKL